MHRKGTMSDPTPARMLYDSLINLFLVVNESDRHVLDRYGLTLPRYHVLRHLNNEPGISFARLSALMLTDRANTSRIVRGMELDGLVTRRQNEGDRRSYFLQLTDKGAVLYAQAAAAHDGDIQARFDSSSRRVEPDLVTRLRSLQHDLDDHLETLKRRPGAEAPR
jgi:DNA-binding MarR family transcriptional regulator